MGRTRAVGGLVAAILVLGVNWPVMKVALDFMDAFWMTALRLGSAAAVLFIVQLARGRPIRLPAPADRLATLWTGLLQMFGMIGLTAIAMLWLPANLTTGLVYTTTIWVMVIEVVAFGLRPAGLSVIAAALGCVGLLMVLTGGRLSALGPNAWPGVASALLAAVSWSGALVISSRHRWQGSPLEVLPWQLVVALVPAMGLCLATSDLPTARMVSTPALMALAYVGPVATLFGMWGINEASRLLPPTLVASCSALTPVVGICAAAIVLEESVSTMLIVGALLVGLGAVLQSLAVTRRRRMAQHAPICEPSPR